MEKLMQYIWQHRLWLQEDLRTVDGRTIQVVDTGRLNSDSGPDFFNAKIMLDGELWAGNIEIHVRASDWKRHRHDEDPAYDSVILHVVDRDDAIVRRKNGEAIPQMRLPCDPDFHITYRNMVGDLSNELPCRQFISSLRPVDLTGWIDSLAFERIYDKEERILRVLGQSSGDWQRTCYVTVARGLGFGLNSEPFERLALSTPLNVLGKHADSLEALEAILFGQSGLLPPAGSDSYADDLRREYGFLCHKFNLAKPECLGWKMARMRPPNFPHRRIAALAAMLHGGFRMMGRITEIETVEQAVELFSPRLSAYWEKRYSFGPASPRPVVAISRSSAIVLAINTVVPLIHALGTYRADSSLVDRAVALLQSLPPERNSIVEMFAVAGIDARNAFQTQALVQLRRNYCEKRKCLYCRIGHRMLALRAIKRR